MTSKLTATVALVTGASRSIGEATARRLAEDGASVALVARRRDRLDPLVAEIERAAGTALAIQADITDRTQAETAVQRTVERFGRLDTLVNNAGLMLLGPVVGADPHEWDRMIAVNAQSTAPHHPRRTASPAQGRREQAEAGRRHRQHQLHRRSGRLERLRRLQHDQVRRERVHRGPAPRGHKRHLRVGVLEPGGVTTELGSHNTGAAREQIDAFYATTQALTPKDIADGVAYMITRPRHASIGELWIMPTDQI